MSAGEAPRDCRLCPRLAAYRDGNAKSFPAYFNGAVPSFGGADATHLIVGLAPGLHGANASGRPFTGDAAGDTLYAALLATGLATGVYAARPNDGLTLNGLMISNAVRCAPPQNKPVPAEIAACNGFLKARIAALPRLRFALALGRIAHDAVLMALGEKRNAFAFAHGAKHEAGGLALYDSYHCSRYNTNTGRLTEPMLREVLARFAAGA